MLHNFLILFGAMAISGILMPLLIKLAYKFKALSPLDFRRKNSVRIPLLGGLGVFLSATAMTLFFNVEFMFKVLICFAPLVYVGVRDDMVQLKAKSKAAIQVLAVVTWVLWIPAETLLLNRIGIPDSLAQGLTIFWMVGILNAVNMIDGMDAEAGGFAVIAFSFFAILSQDAGVTLAAMIMVGSVLGFLLFNKPPAKIYLGETGSTFLGFTLATLGATLPMEGSSPLLILVPLFILAFPEMDAVIAMARRWRSSASLFRGDHDHIHHKLKKLGLNVRHCLIIIYAVSIYCGFTAWSIFEANGSGLVSNITALSVSGLLAILGSVFFLEYRQAHHVSSYSKTILDRYLNLDTDPNIDPKNFHAVLYDLFPYYQELQVRGFPVVNDFAQGFAEYIKENHPDTKLALLGSYTIVAIGPYSESMSSTKDFFSLTTKYYQLLDQFQVTKGDGIIPNGMAIYSSKFRAKEFINKFKLPTHQRAEETPSQQEAA